MIIRGDITNCKEGVFKFLLEALWETISRNEPLGPSRHNDMYDVYAEIRRHEDKSLSIILSDIGLRYTFQKFVPNETYEYNIAPDDTLWTRVSVVFYDLCRRQDKVGWGEFNYGIGGFLDSLEDEQLSVLKNRFLKKILVNKYGYSETSINPLGVIQALLVYAETPQGESRFETTEKQSLRGALLENLEPVMDNEGDYTLDVVSMESVLRAHADPLCPFRFSNRDMKQIMQICRMGYMEPALLSSGAIGFDEFYKLFKKGRERHKDGEKPLTYDICMPPVGCAEIAERFVEALINDLNSRGDNPEVLKKHGRVIEAPLQEWISLRGGEDFPQAILAGWIESGVLLQDKFEEYNRVFMQKGVNLIERLNPGAEIKL